MEVFCGIDWAEDHHDIALVDRDGQLLARRRISDDAAGLAALLGLLAEHGDSADDPIPVAIETPRGHARSTRSTRWPSPATGTGTPSRAANPTTATRSCWPASCAPTGTRTGRCPPTPNWRRRSRCWPAPSKTPCGRAPARTTSSARICASTSPASWPRSPIPAAASRAPKHTSSSPPPPPRPPPAHLPSPSCDVPRRGSTAVRKHRVRMRPLSAETNQDRCTIGERSAARRRESRRRTSMPGHGSAVTATGRAGRGLRYGYQPVVVGLKIHAA